MPVYSQVLVLYFTRMALYWYVSKSTESKIDVGGYGERRSRCTATSTEGFEILSSKVFDLAKTRFMSILCPHVFVTRDIVINKLFREYRGKFSLSDVI